MRKLISDGRAAFRKAREARFQPDYPDNPTVAYLEVQRTGVEKMKPAGFNLTPIGDAGWQVKPTFYNPTTAPAPYDIIWCRFPDAEAPDVPGPKPRPGLVRQSLFDDEGNAWTKVVYGTSRDVFSTAPTAFVVSNLPEMDAAALFRATRFDLATCELLPWSREFFEIPFGLNTPVMGRLSSHMVKILQMQAGYLQHQGLI